MAVWLHLSLVTVFAVTAPNSACDLPCSSPVKEQSQVSQYCQNYSLTLTENGRCCINTTAHSNTSVAVVGLDLRNCSLQNMTNLFQPFTSVVVICLDQNPLLSVEAEDFYGLTYLDYLSLPEDKKCPGAKLAWEISQKTDSQLICQHPINTCSNTENNATCPSPQSYCRQAGPGLVDCYCSPGYHGYKCLRQGTFPLVSFISGISGSTVGLSLFLWITQRRSIKKLS